MVDGLLEAAGLVALRHQRTSLTGSQTLLNAGRLGERLVVDLQRHPAVNSDVIYEKMTGFDLVLNSELFYQYNY